MKVRKRMNTILDNLKFVVDNSGKKVAVLIDLAKCENLWEDVSDALVSESRSHQHTITWDELRFSR